jgi:4-amino-4-deoxy-L-arabinose transferase-like glycosyltransferase
MPNPLRRIDPYLAVLLLAGGVAFGVKWSIAAPIRYIGHADPAAYAEMADSLLRRGNIDVDYISFYYLKYPGLPRPEDHWPPLYSVAIVPFFALLGKSAFAAKLPSMLISCFVLPLLLYAMVRDLGGSRLAALLAGLTNQLHPNYFEWSLAVGADLLYAAIVAAFVLFSMKAVRAPRWWLAAGVMMGLATYAKGSGVLLFGCAVLIQATMGRRGRPLGRVLREGWFLSGLAVGILLLLPWMIHNVRLYGDPLFSTHKYAASTWNVKKLEQIGYDLYWGEKTPPSFLDRFHEGRDVVLRGIWENLKLITWWLTINLGTQWGDWTHGAALTFLTHLPALLGLWLLRRQPQRFVIPIVVLVFVVFHVLSYFAVTRHLAPLPPLMAALGWATWSVALAAAVPRLAATTWGRALRRPRVARSAAGLVLVLVTGFVGAASLGRLRFFAKQGGTMWTEGGQDWMAMGEWMRANLPPDTVTATRNPWELHFYSEQPAIQIPIANLEKTLEVFQFYGATYYIPDRRRPALKPGAARRLLVVKKVHEEGDLRLFRITPRARPAGRG